MKSICFIIALFIMQNICFAQDTLSLQNDFIKTEFPKIYTEEWFKLNHSAYGFIVNTVNNRLEISKLKKGNLGYLKTPLGELRGKFDNKNDSSLIFRPNKNPSNEIIIKKGYITHIFTYNNEIYFIQNINNKNGELYRLDTIDSTLKFKRILKFGDLPLAFAIYKKHLYLATSEKLYEIENYKKKIILRKTCWKHLWPNSMAVLDENNVYFGTFGGIIKIDLINKTTELYIYKDSSQANFYYSKENKSFQTHSRPSKDRNLSLFPKKRISPDLLNNIQYQHNDSTGYSVRLTFEINKHNKPCNIKIQTKNKEFNDTLKRIFSNYPIEELGLNQNNRIGIWSVQLFSTENNENEINARTLAVCDQMPMIEKPDSIDSYSLYSSYFYKTFNDYIIKNIDLKTTQKAKLKGNVVIHLQLTIDQKGNIVDANTIHPNKILKDEIDRVAKSYNKIISPAKRNGISKPYIYDTSFNIFIEDL